MANFKISITDKESPLVSCSPIYKDINCSLSASFDVPRETIKACECGNPNCGSVRRKLGVFKMSDLIKNNCVQC